MKPASAVLTRGLHSCMIAFARGEPLCCSKLRGCEELWGPFPETERRAITQIREYPMQNELFDICCERNPNPKDQRRRLVNLLKAGADIRAADKNGVTALHHAVRFRSPSAVKTLV